MGGNNLHSVNSERSGYELVWNISLFFSSSETLNQISGVNQTSSEEFQKTTKTKAFSSEHSRCCPVHAV